MKKPRYKSKAFESRKVAAVFDAYPPRLKSQLLFLRSMIFQMAAEIDEVGKLEETLKWGSPSYLTSESNSGTTLRIDQLPSQKGKFAMCVHCQTTLVGPFKKIYGDEFDYDANRGVILDVKDEMPVDQLRHFIFLALTYHLRKKKTVKNTWR